jgi:uncharacterized protein YciI
LTKVIFFPYKREEYSNYSLLYHVKEFVLMEQADAAEEQFEIPQNMIVYYLRILKRGPIWTPEETPEVERLQAAHLAYAQKLHEAGKLILNGPVIDGGDLRGVSVLRVRSLEEAQALSDGDPSVKAGRLIAELHPWMVYRGILPE